MEKLELVLGVVLGQTNFTTPIRYTFLSHQKNFQTFHICELVMVIILFKNANKLAKKLSFLKQLQISRLLNSLLFNKIFLIKIESL